MSSTLIIRNLAENLYDYQPVWQAMKAFTANRTDDHDEIWLMQHQSVYTLGQAGDPSHILNQSNIPIVKIDRGGQVTYHGPGQLMMYTLVDLARLSLSVRDYVKLLENVVIEYLGDHVIRAFGDRDAPGVYVSASQAADDALKDQGDSSSLAVQAKKIAALGLRVSRGKTYHGLCFNVNIKDKTAFSNINPCGYQGMQVTDLKAELGSVADQDSDSCIDMFSIAEALANQFYRALPYQNMISENTLPF